MPGGGITWSPPKGYVDLPKAKVPCGQCIGCRLDRARSWSVRMMHEAQLVDEKCFITLTYDDEHLPADGSLRKSDFQKFMKRLRKEYSDRRISYFMCGEYGEENHRPHYHAVLFGVDFEDVQVLRKRHRGKLGRTSAILGRLWGLGFSSVGSVTTESSIRCFVLLEEGDGSGCG